MDSEIRRGRYQHFKGKYYWVIDTAEHSETGEVMVIYRSHEDSPLWVRPKRMFLDDVVVDGKTVPRFRFVSCS